MAKDKKGGGDKPMPRLGEIWENTAVLPIETWDLKAIHGTGKFKKITVLVTFERNGNLESVERTVDIAKFAEPGLRPVSDVNARDEAPSADVPLHVNVLPIKPTGFAFVCPSPSCGDKHEIIVSMAWPEVVKAHARFRERHEAHFSEGGLYGGGAAE